MEITSIKAHNRTMTVKHPATDAPIVHLTLLPFDSPEIKAITRRLTDEANHKRLRGKFFKADEVENNTVELMAACLVGWEWCEGWTFHQEAKPEFNKKNVVSFLKENEWVQPQIDSEVGETKAFFSA